MAINTPLDLITLCLKTSGAISDGQTPAAEDTNDSFNLLNAMIGQWNRKRWLIWGLIDVTSGPATGAQSYTVGIGGDFDTPRPDRLEAAYSRLLTGGTQPVDFPLNIISAYEDYSSITLKELKTFPTSIFYDSSYTILNGNPVGNVYPYPVPPQNNYEIHIIVKTTIQQFPTITTPIVLPPEYTECLIYNLTVRLWSLFRIQPDPVTIQLAKASLNVLRQANVQIPVLRMPSCLMNSNAGVDPTLGSLNGLPWAI